MLSLHLPFPKLLRNQGYVALSTVIEKKDPNEHFTSLLHCFAHSRHEENISDKLWESNFWYLLPWHPSISIQSRNSLCHSGDVLELKSGAQCKVQTVLFIKTTINVPIVSINEKVIQHLQNRGMKWLSLLTS